MNKDNISKEDKITKAYNHYLEQVSHTFGDKKPTFEEMQIFNDDYLLHHFDNMMLILGNKLTNFPVDKRELN